LTARHCAHHVCMDMFRAERRKAGAESGTDALARELLPNDLITSRRLEPARFDVWENCWPIISDALVQLAALEQGADGLNVGRYM